MSWQVTCDEVGPVIAEVKQAVPEGARGVESEGRPNCQCCTPSKDEICILLTVSLVRLAVRSLSCRLGVATAVDWAVLAEG